MILKIKGLDGFQLDTVPDTLNVNPPQWYIFVTKDKQACKICDKDTHIGIDWTTTILKDPLQDPAASLFGEDVTCLDCIKERLPRLYTKAVTELPGMLSPIEILEYGDK